MCMVLVPNDVQVSMSMSLCLVIYMSFVRNTYSAPLPIFNWVICFLLLTCEWSKYKSLIRYDWQIFSLTQNGLITLIVFLKLSLKNTKFFILMKSNYFVAVLWVIFLDLIFKYVKHFLYSKVKRYAQIVSCPFHSLLISSHSCIYLCKVKDNF